MGTLAPFLNNLSSRPSFHWVETMSLGFLTGDFKVASSEEVAITLVGSNLQ